MVGDFSYKSPEDILASLKKGQQDAYASILWQYDHAYQ
jgi:hypothetical protein